MVVQFTNLTSTLHGAEMNHQLQTQYTVLDKQLKDHESLQDLKRQDNKKSKVDQGSEKEAIDKDRGGNQGGAFARRRGNRKGQNDVAPEEKIIPPSGEGSIIDITV
ncbi:MAG: hypothetical protein NUW37_08575 [Planctomycetes bacterium]|nr:hypothetical protein [Planctomycetota bacterium]